MAHTRKGGREAFARKLDRGASIADVARAPYDALLVGHRLRLGRVDGRIRLWESTPPPPAPLYGDEVYLAAYAFEAGERPRGRSR